MQCGIFVSSLEVPPETCFQSKSRMRIQRWEVDASLILTHVTKIRLTSTFHEKKHKWNNLLWFNETILYNQHCLLEIWASAVNVSFTSNQGRLVFEFKLLKMVEWFWDKHQARHFHGLTFNKIAMTWSLRRHFNTTYHFIVITWSFARLVINKPPSVKLIYS